MSQRRHVFALGMGYFSFNAISALYNAFMPLFYREYVASKALIGLFMTFDNILAITIQPVWGAHSDLTRTSLGRRVPYIIIGFVAVAVTLTLLPIWASVGLGVLLAGAIAMNIANTVYRTPQASLLSDLFPKEKRTQQAGAVDFMGGLGAVFALLTAGQLFEIDQRLPFAVVSVILLVTALVMWRFIKEPKPPELGGPVSGDLPHSVPRAFMALIRLTQRSPVLFMAGMFFVTTAWNGLESWWTTYAVEFLQMSKGSASDYAAILGGSYILGAIPAGFAAAKLGRQRAIRTGVMILMLLFVPAMFITDKTMMAVMLALLGFTWPLILVNAIVLFQEFAGPRQVGLFMGMYTVSSQMAQVAGPPMYGQLMQTFGHQALFVTGLVALGIGFLFISRVREGRVTMDSPAPTASGI